MAAGSANLAFLEGKSNDESSRLTGLRISGRRAGSSELNLLTAASLTHLLGWFSSLCVCSCLQIREELRANGIDVYPQKEFDEDAEDRLINDKIRVSSPGAGLHRCYPVTGTRDLAWKRTFGPPPTQVYLPLNRK